jgi:hypothetical protein
MSELLVELEHPEAVAPGGELRGACRWDLAEGQRALQLRLFWYTEGKGTRDLRVVATLDIPEPMRRGERAFRLPVPDGPFSVSGRLVSVRWALELVCEPSGSSCRLDLIVSPSGTEIVLYADDREP